MDDALFAHLYQGAQYAATAVIVGASFYVAGYLFMVGALSALRGAPVITKSNFDGTWRTSL